MVIDFRRKAASVPDLFLDGVKVERVTAINISAPLLTTSLHSTPTHTWSTKKCQFRLYCIQKLRSLDAVKKSVLGAFYRSFIESLIYPWLAVLVWRFECKKNKTLLDRVVNVYGKVIGEKQERVRELYECRAVRKGSKIGICSLFICVV